MAVLLIFTVLMVRIFRWVTGYFREVNQGIESLLADDEKQIQLSPEMLPFERKLNSVKQTLAERKMETALAEQRKDELVMYLAHDIRTPLTSVIGYLNLLEEDPNMPPEQRAARVHIALEKAYRLETMVNEFFEITKYKSQKITLSKETIDLYYMLVQLSDELSPVLAPRGNTVTLHLDENLTIEADPEKLARVFNNILKNAASYSFPHTKSARASRRPARKPLIHTIGTPTRLFIFWNGANTQDAPSISRPTPIPSGTRSSGKRPLKNRRFSTTPTLRSLSRRSLIRCRRFASSGTAGQRRARAACFPAWSIALIVEQKCATAPPTTLKSGRIILYVLTTEAIREAVRHTLSVRLFWKNWSGCT